MNPKTESGADSTVASPTKIIRVLVAKPGLDGHDRGARVIARALRDAGMEVIYTGIHQTPDDIVTACIQEDADVCALSILSGAHNALIPRVCQLLRERGAEDVIVIAGGIIPEDDIPNLISAGVKAVMGPGTSLNAIVETIKSLVAERDSRKSP